MSGRAVGLAIPALLLVACSALFGDAVQCASDADCDKFDAVCMDSVCSKRSPVQGGPGDASNDAPIKPDAPILPAETGDTHCDIPNKPVVELSGDITADMALACTSTYVLKTRVIVRRGATLTIEAGTSILADATTALIVKPGARILANGMPDRPVVMKSSAATPAPGDWLGLYVLGNATSGNNNYFADPDLFYSGGTDDDSDSGVLRYVRIEYGVHGLAMGAVGRKTKVDFVMAHLTSDDGFDIYGGAVDLKHLVSQYAGDEMFEGSDLYQGHLQFFYGTKNPAGDEHHGILLDHSLPQISNVTLCGANLGQSYGLVLRNGALVDMGNLVVTGWFGGIDTRNAIAQPGVEIAYSTFFGNAGNPAYVEGTSADANSYLYDDDFGFNEVAWFQQAARMDSVADPGLVDCMPQENAIPGRFPENNGFFDPAAYQGAFQGANDTWATGAWTRFGDK